LEMTGNGLSSPHAAAQSSTAHQPIFMRDPFN
jgi:hypothetical protein